jgi:hypothetical protein
MPLLTKSRPGHRSFFTWKFLIFLTGFGIVMFFGFRSFMRIKPEDVQEYRQLIENSDLGQAKNKSSPYTAKQQRDDIQKDISFMQGGERLQLRLIAVESQLVLDQHDGETALLEQMRDVHCYMQEELYFVLPDGREALRQSDGQLLIRHADPKNPSSWLPQKVPNLKPMQVIRYLQADEATYYYKTDEFVAQQVALSRFAVPGHQLVELHEGKPLMNGVAEKVEFSLAGKDLNFKAYQLKATFFNAGKIK